MPQQLLDDHLAGCAACHSWAGSAAEVTRRARLTPVVPVPDVTAAVLSRLPATPVRAAPRRRVDVALRVALLVAGLGQLVLGLPALDGGHSQMSMPVHVAHETGAWNLALAACFLGVAALPRLAAGSLPFLLSFTVLLSWVTVDDLHAGHVPADRAVTHLLLVVGAVLVSAIAFRGRAAGSPAGDRVARLLDRSAGWRRARGGAAAHRAAAPAGPLAPARSAPQTAAARTGDPAEERRAA